MAIKLNFSDLCKRQNYLQPTGDDRLNSFLEVMESIRRMFRSSDFLVKFPLTDRVVGKARGNMGNPATSNETLLLLTIKSED